MTVNIWIFPPRGAGFNVSGIFWRLAGFYISLLVFRVSSALRSDGGCCVFRIVGPHKNDEIPTKIPFQRSFRRAEPSPWEVLLSRSQQPSLDAANLRPE